MKLDIQAGLDFPALAADDRLQPVLSGAMQKLGVRHGGRPVVWPASFFALDRVGAFADADEAVRRRILERCSLQLVEEAWFIERAGMAFAARMCLEAPTLEERQLYACFAADEAAHTTLVRGYLPADGAEAKPSGFHDYLAQLIEGGARSTLIAVVQVALEGWGLTHYRRLATSCPDPELATALHSILRDEARHHGSGVVLCARQDLSGRNGDEAVGFLATMLDMVRAGPVAVMEVLDEELDLGPARARVLDELDAPGQIADRLTMLRGLLSGAVPDELLARLADRFGPPGSA